MKTLIAVARDPYYAPCCFILCRVLNPEAKDGKFDWNERDEKNTRLIQTDWDYPGLATTFLWNKARVRENEKCEHDGTDGTIDCPCGVTAHQFIEAARTYLDHCVENAVVVEDPGYFSEVTS